MKEDTETERQWHQNEAHTLIRCYGELGSSTIFFSKQGLRLRTFSDPSEADGFEEWYRRRRHVLIREASNDGPYAEYLRVRSQETLDKGMEDRVYELVRRLTADAPEEDYL